MIIIYIVLYITEHNDVLYSFFPETFLILRIQRHTIIIYRPSCTRYACQVLMKFEISA